MEAQDLIPHHVLLPAGILSKMAAALVMKMQNIAVVALSLVQEMMVVALQLMAVPLLERTSRRWENESSTSPRSRVPDHPMTFGTRSARAPGASHAQSLDVMSRT